MAEYMTLARASRLLRVANANGAQAEIESRGRDHRLLCRGEPVTSWVRVAVVVLWLQGYIAATAELTRRPR